VEGRLLSLKNPRDRVRTRSSRYTGDGFDTLSGGRPKVKRRNIFGPVLVICAILAVLVAADYWMHYGKIYPGVEVGDVALGDMTQEQARGTLEERATSALDEIQLTGGPEGGTTLLPADRLNVDYDIRATVEDAYEVGRRGGVLTRVGNRLEAAWGTVGVPAVVDYNRDIARAQIENLANRTNSQPQDAYVSIDGPRASAVESRQGYSVNVATTAENLEQALQSMSGEAAISAESTTPAVLTPAAEQAADTAQEAMSEPVTLTSGGEEWELSPSDIGQAMSFTPQGGAIEVGLDQEGLRSIASEVYDDLTTEPVEAGYRFSGDEVVVTKSRTGKQIDEDELFGAMNSGLFQGTREYEVPVVVDDPDLTTAQAEALRPTELIGSYRTDYTLASDKSPERVENLDIASRAINETFLAPDEVFSVNEVTSPLKYNKTHVIIDGKEEEADGGGLCQVASTLYNAVTYADLDVVERNPHDAQLPYIRPGLDATVWFGSLDMQFKNTTDGYIMIREYVANDGYIYAEIYGQPTGRTVEIDSESEYLGSDYSKWVTYHKVTDEDGKVVFDDVVHKDTYLPLIDDKGKTIPPNYEYLNIAPVNY
jgi:vancomycin resistance protein YoaR